MTPEYCAIAGLQKGGERSATRWFACEQSQTIEEAADINLTRLGLMSAQRGTHLRGYYAPRGQRQKTAPARICDGKPLTAASSPAITPDDIQA